MTLGHQSPKYRRIAAALRHRIQSGELPPGEQVPSEADIMEMPEFAPVSRVTVRAAIRELVQAGLVEVRFGYGTFVREYAPLAWWPGTFEHLTSRRDTPTAGADAWAADVIAQGREPRQEVEVGIVEPPAPIADRLATPDGELVVVRNRLRLVDGVPFQTADSYYPRDVAENTPIMSPGDITVPGGFMAAVGHRQVRFRDEITVRMPTPTERDRLHLLAATPVAEHLRTGYDTDGRAVRVIVTIVPGDRHTIIYEVGGE